MKQHNKDKIVSRKSVFHKRYRVLDPLRNFPGGTIYMGLNRDDKSRVYLRVYHGVTISSDEDFATFEDEFFKYRDHSFDGYQKVLEILKVSIEGIENPFPVVVLERPKGITARRLLANSVDEQLPINEAAFIISEAASICLKALHDGMQVSEIFLQDIMHTKEGHVVVMHLPILPSADDSNFFPESQQKFYSPPERWEDNSIEVNEQIIVYQLACLFFQLLEGHPPFLNDDQEQQHKQEKSLGLEGIPRAADKLILQSLSKKPSKRPDLKKFAFALRSFTKHKAINTVKNGGGGLSKLLLVLLIAGGGYMGYDHFMIGKKKTKRKSRVVAREVVETGPRKVLIEAEIDEIENMYLFQEINFEMGHEECSSDCKPVHTVELSDFYIDKYEVSNENYLAYMEQTQTPPPGLNDNPEYNLWDNGRPSDRILNQPVINITWNQAKAYCEHFDKRLPTEAEWEFAARGVEGRSYPWGDDAPDPELAQFEFEWLGEDTLYEVDYFKEGTTDEGLFNMFGGVKEWVSDYYEATFYLDSPAKDPKGPEKGTKRSIRGGAWAEPADPVYTRDARNPDTISELIGFRCAKTLIMQPPREVWLDNEGNEVPPPEEYLDSELKSIDSSESTSVTTDSVVGNPEDLMNKQSDSNIADEEWGDDSEDWDD
mgnify:CR=1 FL=1